MTGAGGFCGRTLTRLLAADEVEVHTLGRRAAGQRHHEASPCDYDTLCRIVGAIRPQWLFHLAGVARESDPATYYTVNTLFGVNLLRSLEETGCSETAIVLAGSAAEYGPLAPEDCPVDESRPGQPRGHYGISKLAQTLAALEFAARGARVVVARLSNVVGPHMPATLALGQFTRALVGALASGERVVQTGPLSAIRDFIDVRDAMEIMWLLARTPAAYGQVVNVGRGEPISLRALASMLERAAAELLGAAAPRFQEQGALRPDETPAHYPSQRRLRTLVGDLPRRPLDATVRETLEAAMAAGGRT